VAPLVPKVTLLCFNIFKLEEFFHPGSVLLPSGSLAPILAAYSMFLPWYRFQGA